MTAMTLTYELPKAEFDRFLLNSFGIETNELSVRDAVRAARMATWPSYCKEWGATVEELLPLHTLLLKVRHASAATPKQREPGPPLSPQTQSRVDAEKAMQQPTHVTTAGTRRANPGP